tara:strand:- start:9223 stop:9675 length:453 start_codon:yes stop_codon:yes gene_type:complete
MKSYVVEIENDLNELVSSAIEEIKRSIAWLVKEGEIDDSMDADDINEALDYDGTKHEIIDGSVPVYTAQLEALFFVHKWDLMEAFNDAGICTVDEVLSNPDSFQLGLEGVAIFCYIEQAVNAWIWDDLEAWFNSKFQADKGGIMRLKMEA